MKCICSGSMLVKMKEKMKRGEREGEVEIECWYCPECGEQIIEGENLEKREQLWDKLGTE